MKKRFTDINIGRKNGNYHVLRFAVFLVAGALTAGSPLQAQDIQTQGSPIGGNAQVSDNPGFQPAGAGQQAGQYQQAGDQPVDVADIEEDELTAFDPSTIPDAAPTPEADWLFEVPIDVEGISEEVQQLGIICKTFRVEIHGFNSVHYAYYGEGKKKIDLENGAYHGSVLIGVNSALRPSHPQYRAHLAEKYNCWMYLVGPDNRWHVPKKDRNVSPAFRRMSRERPFRWKTGPVSIPPDARLPAP